MPLGGIQQLRGQEGGEGGQQKVHACPIQYKRAPLLVPTPWKYMGGYNVRPE